MDQKTFYGEYTLHHWIELILRGNIKLPEYQRSFVWSKPQVESFLKNIKNGLFIPPVIIGALENKEGNENIILDGQQRLTSILLGYLGIFPKADAFHTSDFSLYIDATEEDDNEDEIEDDEDEVIEWTFRILLSDKRNKTKADILATIDRGKYDFIGGENCLDEIILNSTYLGFSYIVPSNTATEKEQQRFYSTVFHDINQQGIALRGQESRRSLYYLNKDLVPYFEPSSLCSLLKITQNGKTRRYDYVRALAFLSEYKKGGKRQRIASGCRSQEKLEIYYEDFINAVVSDGDSRFGRFSELIGIGNISERTDRLRDSIIALGFDTIVFSTIIDADTKLFGLIYHIIFENKNLRDDTQYAELKKELDDKAEAFRAVEGHRKSPNGIKYLRVRIKDSIEIYSCYVDK